MVHGARFWLSLETTTNSRGSKSLIDMGAAVSVSRGSSGQSSPLPRPLPKPGASAEIWPWCLFSASKSEGPPSAAYPPCAPRPLPGPPLKPTTSLGPLDRWSMPYLVLTARTVMSLSCNSVITSSTLADSGPAARSPYQTMMRATSSSVRQPGDWPVPVPCLNVGPPDVAS